MNQKVYEKAVKLLSRRFHTTGELHRKLVLRKYKEADITAVLQELERLGFLDDQRFARIFVENMKLYKDWGYFGIKNKLIQKKVPNEMIEDALNEFLSLEDELKIAERVVEKLNRKGRTEREKILASLQRKGFRNEVLAEVLSAHFP